MAKGEIFRHFCSKSGLATVHFLLVGGFALLWGAVSPVQAGGVGLASHRADYQLSLKRSDSGAVNGVRGLIRYDWSSDCKGWIVRNDLVMSVAYHDGQERRLAFRYSTWEAMDGSRYRFAVHQGDDVEGRTSSVGSALRNRDKNEVVVRLKVPEEREVEHGDVLFPTAFLAKLLRSAKRGEQVLMSPVFDGTDEAKVYQVSAVMLPEANPKPAFPALEGQKAWRTFWAFYDPEAGGSVPFQEQALLIYENGVVSEMTLNFGEFEVAGRLSDLRIAPEPQCNE